MKTKYSLEKLVIESFVTKLSHSKGATLERMGARGTVTACGSVDCPKVLGSPITLPSNGSNC